MTRTKPSTPTRPAGIVAKPYSRVLAREPDGRWSGSILEFPGCYADGDTASEAISRLDDALAALVEVMFANQERIPEPIMATEYNGRVSLRIPPNLHRDCVRMAAAQGVSLNRFLSDAVARYVGEQSACHQVEVDSRQGSVARTFTPIAPGDKHSRAPG